MGSGAVGLEWPTTLVNVILTIYTSKLTYGGKYYKAKVAIIAALTEVTESKMLSLYTIVVLVLILVGEDSYMLACGGL